MPKNVSQLLLQMTQECLKSRKTMSIMISRNVKWAVIFVLIQMKALAYNAWTVLTKF